MESDVATEMLTKLERPLRPSIRLKAFTTPTVANIVKRTANGVKSSNVSKPGIPNLNNQTLNIIIARTLETMDAPIVTSATYVSKIFS